MTLEEEELALDTWTASVREDLVSIDATELAGRFNTADGLVFDDCPLEDEAALDEPPAASAFTDDCPLEDEAALDEPPAASAFTDDCPLEDEAVLDEPPAASAFTDACPLEDEAVLDEPPAASAFTDVSPLEDEIATSSGLGTSGISCSSADCTFRTPCV